MSKKYSIDRKEFLKTGAALGMGAAALLTNTPAAAAEKKPKSAGIAVKQSRERVRIAVIGVGSQGTRLTQGLTFQPDVDIPAICDVRPQQVERAQNLVQESGRPRPDGYSDGPYDYLNMLRRDDIDGVVIATPWELHTEMTIATLKSGKYCAPEVRGAFSIQELWDIVKTSEETGMPVMLLENHNYYRNELAVLNMVRAGLFGELIHGQCGYQHDIRHVKFRPGVEFGENAEGAAMWRTKHSLNRNGDLYPTHGLGPIAMIFDINRGNRFVSLVSMATKARGLNSYIVERGGKDHPYADIEWGLGDIVTTIIKCANGETIVINHDTNLPRPYSNMGRVQGTKGIWMEDNSSIYLEGMSPGHRWEPFEKYREQYEHPLWKNFLASGVRGGHGGADYLKTRAFAQSVKRRLPTPIDVYDMATWLAVTALSEQSIAMGGAPVPFPDFTNGKWTTTKPSFGLESDF